MSTALNVLNQNARVFNRNPTITTLLNNTRTALEHNIPNTTLENALFAIAPETCGMAWRVLYGLAYALRGIQDLEARETSESLLKPLEVEKQPRFGELF